MIHDATSKVNICRDPKDNYLLSLAIDANADFIITGDNDLLILQTVRSSKIISYKEFGLFFSTIND